MILLHLYVCVCCTCLYLKLIEQSHSKVTGNVIGNCRMSVFVCIHVKFGSVLSSKSPERLPSLFPVEPELVELPWAASQSVDNWNLAFSDWVASNVALSKILPIVFLPLAHTGYLDIPFARTRSLLFLCPLTAVGTVLLIAVRLATGNFLLKVGTGGWFSSLRGGLGSALISECSSRNGCSRIGIGRVTVSCCFKFNAARMPMFQYACTNWTSVFSIGSLLRVSRNYWMILCPPGVPGQPDLHETDRLCNSRTQWQIYCAVRTNPPKIWTLFILFVCAKNGFHFLKTHPNRLSLCTVVVYILFILCRNRYTVSMNDARWLLR